MRIYVPWMDERFRHGLLQFTLEHHAGNTGPSYGPRALEQLLHAQRQASEGNGNQLDKSIIYIGRRSVFMEIPGMLRTEIPVNNS